jgi:hypothetical protein
LIDVARDVMPCAVCGAELERLEGHSCGPEDAFAIGPPRRWTIGTWALIGFTGLYVAFAALAGVLAAGRPGFDSIEVNESAGAHAVLLGWLVGFIGTVLGQRVWYRSTRRIAKRYGDDNFGVRSWFFEIYGVVFVVSVFLQPMLGLDDHDGILFVTVVRVGAGLLLIGNVLLGRSRLLGLIADSARQSWELHNRPASTPAPLTEYDRWSRITPEE